MNRDFRQLDVMMLSMVSTRDNFLSRNDESSGFIHDPNPKGLDYRRRRLRHIKEVLKHSSVEHAVQIDIDERVTAWLNLFSELCESNNDPEPNWNLSTASNG